MAITREQIKAANKRGSAAIARGPVARAARYDARRALIVISLEGGCEFSFPTALAEGLTDAPRSKLKKIEISPNSGRSPASALRNQDVNRSIPLLDRFSTPLPHRQASLTHWSRSAVVFKFAKSALKCHRFRCQRDCVSAPNILPFN
jgi:hypothetical protein